MAQVVVEKREFKDRDTQIITEYMYFAIKGGKPGNEYEVPLKNLVGSEKTALQMLADIENISNYSVSTRASNDEETNDFFNKNNNSDPGKIDLEEE